MPKIAIDRDLCTGCGLCVSLCPEAFELDKETIAKAISNSCRDHDMNDVASQCPVEAIKVE